MSQSPPRRPAMFDLSQSTANALFGVSNVLTIIGGVLVVVGAIGIFWMGGIRERYADVRIGENEAKTASAVAESARANESNTRLRVELERENVERLRLERQVSPRHLTKAMRTDLVLRLKAISPLTVAIINVGDPETRMYTDELGSAIRAGGHTVVRAATKLTSAPRFGLEIASTADSPAHRQFSDALKVTGEPVEYWHVSSFGEWSQVPGADIELYVNYKGLPARRQ